MSGRSLALRLLAAATALLVVSAAAVWLGRDLPRRLVESVLARQLGARIELGELEIAADRLVLRRLRIEEIPGLDAVERLTIAELEVEGSWREWLRGRFARVQARGAEARLVPAPIELDDEPPTYWIGELEIEPATVTIVDPEAPFPAELVLVARLRDVGGESRGELRLSSSALELAPVLALAAAEPGKAPVSGRLRSFAADLRLGAVGVELSGSAEEAVVEARGGSLVAAELRATGSLEGRPRLALDTAEATLRAGGQALEIRRLRLEAARTTSADGGEALRVELDPELEVASDARLAAEWDLDAGRLLAVDGRLEGLPLSLLADAEATGEADLEISGAGERLHYSARLRPGSLALDDARLRTPGATLAIEGEAPFPRDPAALAAGGVEEIAAALAGPLTARLELPAVNGRLGGIEPPAAAFPLAATFTGELTAERRLRGDLALRSRAAGRLTGQGELALEREAALDLAWRWQGAPLERLEPLLAAAGLELPAAVSGGRVAGRGRLRGTLGRPRLDASLEAHELAAAGVAADERAWRLESGEARAELAWSPAELRVRSLEATGELTLEPLAPRPFAVSGRLRGDPALSAGTFEEVVVLLPELGRIELAGRWLAPSAPAAGTDAELRAEADVRLDDVELERWQRVLEPWLGDPGFALKGQLDTDFRARLEVTSEPRDRWRLSGGARIASAGFASTDGARVVEGLASRWELDLEGAPGAPLRLDARGDVGGFQLLWGTFFGDFSGVTAGVELALVVEPASAGDDLGPWRGEARVEVAEGPVLELELGRPAPGPLRYRLALADDDLARTHERYLRQVLSQYLERPDLGGRVALAAAGEIASAEVWSVDGRLDAAELSWTSGGGQATIAGLELALPLGLARAQSGEIAGPRQDGRLGFERLALGDLELSKTASGLWVEGDSVGIEEPVALSILDGRVSFERLSLRRLLRPDRHLASRLALSGLSLERISEGLGFLPLEGTLEGAFPAVRITLDELEVEGGGTVSVFGGTVEVGSISGREIFSRFPEIELSADFHDLDLGRLTRRFGFGEMTGVLQGWIRDCLLFRGVPVRFEAYLETVKRKGVKRTIDVKAINNLSILGTGFGTDVFDRGLRRFFDRYTYSRLAVALRLENDRLLLRGREKRGHKELFLRGRLPFPIDVVNAQPGQTVSFQAMLRRLGNIDFAKASTE